jgi:pimeloyl-ACP methyl ester carboxylesterase
MEVPNCSDVSLSVISPQARRRHVWKRVPSWLNFGDQDRNIPVGAHRIMAERASAKSSLEIPGASHVVGVSHPEETAEMILEAARSRSNAKA